MKVIQKYTFKEDYQEECKDRQNFNYMKLVQQKVSLIHLNMKYSKKNYAVDMAQKTICDYILQKKAFQDKSITR